MARRTLTPEEKAALVARAAETAQRLVENLKWNLAHGIPPADTADWSEEVYRGTEKWPLTAKGAAELKRAANADSED